MTGGRGSGKSTVIPEVSHNISFEDDNVILISRFTMESAKNSIIPEFAKSLENRGSGSFFKVIEKEIINKISGSKIIFKGIKTGSKTQTANLKSIAGLNVWIVDEAEELHDEQAFDDADGSIREKNKENLIILSLNTYRIGKNHFIKKKFFTDKGLSEGFNGVIGNVLYIHTTYKNNIANLSEGYLRKIHETKKKYSDSEIDFFQKNKFVFEPPYYYNEFGEVKYSNHYNERYLGKFPESVVGLVYPLYNVVDEIPKRAKRIPLGLDYGYINDPLALVDIYYLDGNIYVDELIYETGLTNLDNPNFPNRKTLQSKFRDLKISKNRYIVADTNEPKTNDSLIDLGYSVVKTKKYAGSVADNINAVKNFKINVTRRSTHIIFELDNYMYDNEDTSTVIKNPIKKHDHAMNAIAYAVASKNTLW
ncbi:MAG: hypothetical protein IMY67_01770 [Bacteroidetes bacterium]|nr:hypothetical protein [Bacteroidota bacterium]